MENVMIHIKWVGEQVCNSLKNCFDTFREFQEENIPLFTNSRTIPRYYGHLTPPNEVDRVNILVEEQPTIISIIDNKREDSPIPMTPCNFDCENDTDTEIYYDSNILVASV